MMATTTATKLADTGNIRGSVSISRRLGTRGLRVEDVGDLQIPPVSVEEELSGLHSLMEGVPSPINVGGAIRGALKLDPVVLVRSEALEPGLKFDCVLHT